MTTKGHEALSLFYSHQPDIVILDLGLPDIDGLEVIQEIKKISSKPIIVVSARLEEQEKIEGAIDSIQNLTVEIAVKNEGYFNGSIRLKNSNFKFVTENETYEGIQSVGEEEIKLEQINAGSTRKISLKIEAKKKERELYPF